MKKLLKDLAIIAVILLALALLLRSLATHAATFQGYQGGTGISTSTSGNDGKCLQQASSSPFFTWTIGTCGSSSTSSVTGTGVINTLTFWTGTSTVSSTNFATVDNTNGILQIANDQKLRFAGGSGNYSQLKSGTDGTFIVDTGAGQNVKIKGGDSSGTNYLAFTDTSLTPFWQVFSDGHTTQASGSVISGGTLAITSLGSAGNPCLSVSSVGVVATSSCLTTNTIGPSTSTYSAYFTASSTLAGDSRNTFTASTGQTRFQGSQADTPGTSVSTGGQVNIGVATDTEGLVIYTSSSHALANLLYVNCDATGSIQGCTTIRSTATSSSPLNVQTWSLNKSGVKVDVESTGTINANSAAFGADLSSVGTSSAQGIRIFCTNYCDGNPLGLYGPSAALRFAIDASGTYTAVGNGFIGGTLNVTSTITQSGTPVVLNTRAVNSGGILTGGGALSSDQTISLTTTTLNTNVASLGYITSSAAGTPCTTTNGTHQYNNSGAFGCITEFTYNTTTQQNRFTAQANVNYGNSITTGGILNITNTQSTSTDFVINDSEANRTGRGVLWNFTSQTNAQDSFTLIAHSTGSTPFNIQGYTAGKGTIKIEHFQPEDASTDANASAISIALNGTSTAAQGIFMDSASGTTGNLAEWRNQGVTEFRVSSGGNITANGNAFIAGNLNVTGTATFASTFTQSGGLVSLASTTINGQATTTNLTVTSITGTQCLHAVNGLISGVGADCDAPLGTGQLTTSTITYSKQLDATSTVVVAANTSTAQTAYSFTVPANTLGTTGATIRIHAFGTFRNASSTSNQTITVAATYGGSTAISIGSSNIATSTNTAGFDFEFQIANASGTTNNQIAGAYLAIKGGGTNTFNGGSGAPIAIDSTAGQTLTITIKNSAADATIVSTLNSIQVMLDGATTTVVSGGTGLNGGGAASQVAYFNAANQVTSSLNLTYDGATLTNSGYEKLTASSSIVTPSISGAIISGGCDSATSSIDTSYTSSTTAFITTPQNDPGTTLGGTWVYSLITSSGVLTTRVCSNVSVTPNATAYNVKLIK